MKPNTISHPTDVIGDPSRLLPYPGYDSHVTDRRRRQCYKAVVAECYPDDLDSIPPTFPNPDPLPPSPPSVNLEPPQSPTTPVAISHVYPPSEDINLCSSTPRSNIPDTVDEESVDILDPPSPESDVSSLPCAQRSPTFDPNLSVPSSPIPSPVDVASLDALLDSFMS